jgi:hypothetical protein
MITLADAIVDLPALEKLDLSSNKLCCNSFGDRNPSGFDAFCNTLWRVKKLKELRFGVNGSLNETVPATY